MKRVFNPGHKPIEDCIGGVPFEIKPGVSDPLPDDVADVVAHRYAHEGVYLYPKPPAPATKATPEQDALRSLAARVAQLEAGAKKEESAS